MTRKEGTIVRWDEAKGFGFIRGDVAAQDVFMHVRDYRGDAAPRQGLRVSYEDVHVGGKGPRAMVVRAAAAPRPARRPTQPAPRPARGAARDAGGTPSSGAWWALPLMLAYGAALAWLAWQRQIPSWVLPASLVLNLATFLVYWQDKYAAQKQQRRVSENTLHLWSLAGGWGGAWFAQQVLRHKSAKASFRAAYVATVFVHCAALCAAWWALGPGRNG